MKTKYFEYNRNGGSEKYSEFTEEEYLKAKEDENRWFISFGDSVLECEESQYTDHFSKKDHDEYTQKDKNWKKVIPVSLEQYTYGGNSEQKILKDSTVVPLEERVLEQLSLEHDLEKLRRAMEKLKPYEQKIIYQIFYEAVFHIYFHTIFVPLVLSRNHQHSVAPFLPTWLTLIH